MRWGAIPWKGPSSSRELDDRRYGPPVALAVGDEVEVRRAPVLDQRGPGVPARPPVHLLDIATALAAGGHQVALLAGLLRRQPYLVGGALDAAERAAELGEGPGATAEMTGQHAATVLDHVDEAWRAAAE